MRSLSMAYERDARDWHVRPDWRVAQVIPVHPTGSQTGGLPRSKTSLLTHSSHHLQKTIRVARSAAPAADAAVKKEVEKSIASIEKSMCPEVPGEKKYLALPAEGLSLAGVRSELKRFLHYHQD